MQKRLGNLILICSIIAIILFIIGCIVNLFAFIVGIVFFSCCISVVAFREQLKEIRYDKYDRH
jgi:cell division protein FtsW (lipid II flippase)